MFGGTPGPLRLLNSALGGQAGWLLGFALVGGVGDPRLARRLRRARPAHRLADRGRRRVPDDGRPVQLRERHLPPLLRLAARAVHRGARRRRRGPADRRADERAHLRPGGRCSPAWSTELVVRGDYPGQLTWLAPVLIVVGAAGSRRARCRERPAGAGGRGRRRARAAADRARGLGLRHARARDQRHLPRRRPGIGLLRAARRPRWRGGPGGGSRPAFGAGRRRCRRSGRRGLAQLSGGAARPAGAGSVLRGAGAGLPAGRPRPQAAWRGGAGGAPAAAGGVRRQRSLTSVHLLRRTSTAAARSRSPASRAQPRRSSSRTPTWRASAASRAARATSASPGWRRRCAPGKIRWVLDEESSSAAASSHHLQPGRRLRRGTGSELRKRLRRRLGGGLPGDTRAGSTTAIAAAAKACVKVTAASSRLGHSPSAGTLYDCSGRASELASGGRVTITA